LHGFLHHIWCTDSLCRTRFARPPCHHTPPIQTLKQRLKLCLRQAHYSVKNLWPCELAMLQPLIAQHKARPVPEQHLDPVATFGAKHNDDARMGIKTKFALCQGGQAIVTLAEIYWFGRDHDPNRLAWIDHACCAKWRAIPAIRLGVVFLGRRTDTKP
jgi:hypothetical protein